MTHTNITVSLIGLIFLGVILGFPVYLKGKAYVNSRAFNPPPAPPVANPDTYTRHGNGAIGNVLTNDTDPDGDPLISAGVVTQPSHGIVQPLTAGFFHYQLTNSSYVGPDSFTYQACAAFNSCSAPATVTLNVVNQAPTAVNDSYTVHGSTVVGPMMANDFDPDGDTIIFNFLTQPSHGTVEGIPVPPGTPDQLRFQPANPYTGPDSFTYKVCDSLGLCSGPATVTVNIVNNPPTPGPDRYGVRGTTIIGPVKVNDTDPDGDQLGTPAVIVGPAHGTLLGLSGPFFTQDQFQYTPVAGFAGTDSFVYRICDLLQKCSDTTVTLNVEGDGQNLGASCQAKKPARAPQSVGKPVEVTTGNMYLQQIDHLLAGAGNQIKVHRTYNSQSTATGLFGKGWSTAYDESLQIYDANTIRLNEADGRATYFGRAIGSSGLFLPLEGDFQGQITQNAGGYALSLQDGSVHQFNSTGRLLSFTDLHGNQTTLAYNLSGKLSSVTDPFGRVVAFLVFNNLVTMIADTTGIIAEYTYDTQKLVSVTYEDTSGYQFAYDSSSRLTTVSDKLGNILESHAYDSQGRATTSERQGGVERYTLSYATGRTDVTDALGRVTKYFFDRTKARNVVTKIEGLCNCGGGGSQATNWTYDNNLNLTSSTDALGRVTSYTYDAAGNMLTMTDPTGTQTFTYNSVGKVLTHTDQMGGVTTNTYSAAGDVLTTNNALNKTTTFTYDTRGQLLTLTDARNNVTTLTWDTSGRLTQVRDPLNNTTNFTYDLRVRQTSTTNPLNQTTSYQYDPVGRLKKIIYPDTTFVEFTYDLGGRQTKIKDARGNETNFFYDGAYRLTSVTDALNHSTTFGYDLMSNKTSETDALGRVTNFEVDEFDRLKKIIYPPAMSGATRQQETFEYDAAGNISKTTDTAGRNTTYLYDSSNRTTKITDPALRETQYEYNTRSQTTKIIDALGQQYQFAYDALGRVTQTTRAGVSMSYVYDAVGNRTQRTDYNGAVTNYTFDALNRLTTISYPNSTSATYAYDALSRLTSATNQNGIVSFTYDVRGRRTSTTDVWGKTLDYSYDANGNRTGLSVNSTPYASYIYDSVDRLTNLADSAAQNFVYNYDAVNRLTSRLAPNGVTMDLSYDDLDRLTELRHTKTPATLAIGQYGYDNANRITAWLGSGGNRSFNRDASDRVTSALKMGGNESYNYDAASNRTSSHLSATHTYQPFNRLASTASATYAYDNNGNLMTKTDGSGTRGFTWNYENRLTNVTLPGGLTVSYKYDALNRQTQRTTSAGADERYVYDGNDVLLDLDSTSAVTTSYLNGLEIDEHLRQTNTTTGVSYFLVDHLGSTSAITDAAGNVVETLNYDSFGNNSGSSRTRYTYTGRERDPDTGLLYYRARFYDPEVGRFISEDPAGLAAGMNLYTYVNQDPVVQNDPSGLWPSALAWKVHQKIIRRSLVGRAQPWEIRILMQEQYDFDSSTQAEEHANKHATTKRGQTKADARKMANAFVRERLCRARELAAQGNRGDALKALSQAMHTLQDSTSPAHANFQVAWGTTKRELVNHIPHYLDELFDPGYGSVADELTLKAWQYFTGELPMPDDFFLPYYDSSIGRLPHGGKKSPDGSLGCSRCYGPIR